MRGDRGPRGVVHRNTKKLAGENYTGSATGSSPAWGGGDAGVSTPGTGVALTVTLPIDDDDDGTDAITSKQSSNGLRVTRDNTKARLRTQLKAIANFVTYLMQGSALSEFVPGFDGDVTLDGSVAAPSGMSKSGTVYTMNRDFFPRNLTLTGCTVATNGYRLTGSGTLDLSAGTGYISNKGSDGAAGGGGGAGAGGAGAPAGTLPGGTAAGAGGAAGGNGVAGTAITGFGGAGGAGANDTHTGGAGGVVTTPAANLGSPHAWIGSGLAGYIMGLSAGTPTMTGIFGGSGGGGGGGQGGDGGAGGGGGGGCMVVVFRVLNLAAANKIYCNGGNGGSRPAAPGGGGGGGGGGGVLIIAYGKKNSVTFSAADNAAGGVGGTTQGLNQAPSGANGAVYEFALS